MLKSKGWHLDKWALAAAVLLLLLRFSGLGSAPFILDEPQFLAAATEQVTSGHWATQSPLVGNQGLRYGPGVVWFFGSIQRLLGPAPQLAIACMCVTFTLAQLALAWALTCAFGGFRTARQALASPRGRWLLAALIALMASSAYEFFWSRMAWDQPLVGAAACAAIAAFASRPLGWVSIACTALFLGLALCTHVEVLPLIALVALVVIVERRRRSSELALVLGVMLGIILLINVPWLTHLQLDPAAAMPVSDISLRRFFEVFRVASFARIDYFFDDDWLDFLRFAHGETLIPTLGWLCMAAVTVLTVFGLWTHARQALPNGQRLIRLAALAALVYPLFYGLRGVGLDPHYQTPLLWLVPVGCAAALSCKTDAPAAAAIRVTVAVVVVLQAGFIVAWKSYIDERGGTRGVHYSVPVAQQAEFVRAACAVNTPRVEIQNLTQLFPASLAYAIAHEPLCANKSLGLCRSGDCPPVSADVSTMRLYYANPTGGRVAWKAYVAQQAVADAP